MWRITIATGLRHGEVLGLSWDDFNPDTGTLYICNQLQRQTGNGLVLKSTLKADALARSIVLDEETLNLMKAWRIEQNATRLRLGSWGKLELVFTNYVDNPMEPRKAAYRWKELLTKAEMQIEGCTMPDIHLRQFFYRVESKSKLSVTIWVTQI